MANDKSNKPAPAAPGGVPTDAKPKENAILSLLGPAIYSLTAGAITLYPDKKRPNVKNGRAGHVTFQVSPLAQIQASIYMDVEPITSGEHAGKVKKSYRLAFPKGVSVSLGTETEANRFKHAHADAWKAAKDAGKAKQVTTEADGGDSAVVEIE